MEEVENKYSVDYNVEVSQVENPEYLGIICSKNFVYYEGLGFFDLINENINDCVKGVELDAELLSKLVGSGKTYSEIVSNFEKKSSDPNYRANKMNLEKAFDYMTMFLSRALIIYGPNAVSIDGDMDGMEVISGLYDKFSPSNDKYLYFEDFINYYKSMNDSKKQKLVGKKGVN